MSSLAIKDIDGTTALDRTALAGITGGMDVKIEHVDSAIRSTDSPSLPGSTLTALVNIVIGSLRG